MTWSSRRQSWIEPAYYLLVGGLVMGPLLRSGYILTFDMAWTQHLAAPAVGNASSTLVEWALHALSLVVPSLLIQKLLLWGLLLLAGWGMHRLVKLRWSGPAAYLAGTFAMFNPWLYTRFMAGQYLVLAGFALLPWLLAAVWRVLEAPARRQVLALIGWSVALGWLSIHAIGLALLAGLVMVLLHGRVTRRAWLALGLAAGAWLVVNLFWLGPLVAGVSAQAREIASFNLAQAEAFRTANLPGLPAPLATALLEGFWADPVGRYVLPSSSGWLFGLAAAVWGALVITGAVVAIRRRDRLGLALIVIGIISWWLAVGLAWGPSAGTSRWLIEHLPFYRGYREPQKWAALLAISYAGLAALGLDAWRRRWPWADTQPLELGLRLVPLALVPMALWGMGGQLRSVDYPRSWYQLNQRLLYRGPVLILPWHQYMYLDFAGRVVANPAPNFFTTRTVTSANPEMPGVPNSAAAGSLAQRLEDDVLAYRGLTTDAGRRISRLGINYVAVLKQADWAADAAWLSTQAGLTLVEETGGWQLWRVEAAP
ncbi:MAG TPA: hypothetical protein VI322_02995 [Candidatus Saccharimonadia bacterium]